MLRSSTRLRLSMSQPRLGCYDMKVAVCHPVFMETIITSEQDLRSYKTPFSPGVRMIHFKIVGVGPNTLAQAGYLGSNVCDIATRQPGFFVISGDGSGLRQAMHDLVDRFCDAQEGKNESTNS